MATTEKSLLQLTAGDLMTPTAVVLREGDTLRQAAEDLFAAGVHGAPVVDGAGVCVGVLSVTDVARWAARKDAPASNRPKACSHQETHRAVRGEETTVCTVAAGKCSMQGAKSLPAGTVVQACRAPDFVSAEWQMVELEILPVEDVRHYMTSGPVTADPLTPITAVAQAMTNACVQRVIVVEADHRPVGVVSATDLVAALAEVGDEGSFAGGVV